jgi:K+:H+ antiporter
MGLSTALGAFLAGMLIGVAKETTKIWNLFECCLSLYFFSIGMLIDLDFLRTYWIQVRILLMPVLFVNTFINGVDPYWFGDNRRDSLYAATLLFQIGEFSFVLAAVGIQAHIISDFGYQLTIAVIGLSLLLSPAWITSIKHLLYRRP